VRIIEPVAEAEIVAAFLRAEWESDRWRQQLEAILVRDGLDPSVVTDPQSKTQRSAGFEHGFSTSIAAGCVAKASSSGFPHASTGREQP
jgi:hypothetical protein